MTEATVSQEQRRNGDERRPFDFGVRSTPTTGHKRRQTRAVSLRPGPALVCRLLRPVGRLRRQSNGCDLFFIPPRVDHPLHAHH